MAKKGNLHIGQLIKAVLDKSGMSVTEFAKRISCTRPNVYDIFERSDIGVEQLIEISKVLEHNFFDDIQCGSGLESQLQVRQLNIHFNIKDLSPEKINKISEIVMRLNQDLAN